MVTMVAPNIKVQMATMHGFTNDQRYDGGLTMGSPIKVSLMVTMVVPKSKVQMATMHGFTNDQNGGLTMVSPYKMATIVAPNQRITMVA